MPESEETASGQAPGDRAVYHNVWTRSALPEPRPTSMRRYAMTGRAPLPYDFMPAVLSFELRSDDVADGQMMSQNQVFGRVRHDRQEYLPLAVVVRLPGKGQELRGDLVRPGRADRFRLVALGRARHPRVGDQTRGGRGRHRRFRPARRGVHVRNDYMVKDFGGAAPRKETRRTVTCSRYMRSTWSRWASATRSHLPWPASPCVSTPSRVPCSSRCTATDLQQRSPRRAGSQPGRLASWASSHGDMSARWRLSGEVCAG